ncbi:unnamed protein product [Caenorhabditis auriculariae]|uniref:Uncharacterized protein n=1 Tax=Caenorhabditis auriculariae TaxID=2777116 RepID=A0A8S1GT81_9PELO|nr:unnamed protein product [Caenorhabditis auriculariae]
MNPFLLFTLLSTVLAAGNAASTTFIVTGNSIHNVFKQKLARQLVEGFDEYEKEFHAEIVVLNAGAHHGVQDDVYGTIQTFLNVPLRSNVSTLVLTMLGTEEMSLDQLQHLETFTRTERGLLVVEIGVPAIQTQALLDKGALCWGIARLSIESPNSAILCNDLEVQKLSSLQLEELRSIIDTKRRDWIELSEEQPRPFWPCLFASAAKAEKKNKRPQVEVIETNDDEDEEEVIQEIVKKALEKEELKRKNKAKDEDDDEDDAKTSAKFKKLNCKYRKSCYETGDVGDIDSLDFSSLTSWFSSSSTEKSKLPDSEDADQDGVPDADDEDVNLADRKLICKYRPSCYEKHNIPKSDKLKEREEKLQHVSGKAHVPHGQKRTLKEIAESTLKRVEKNQEKASARPLPNSFIVEKKFKEIEEKLRKKTDCKYRKSCYESGVLPDIETSSWEFRIPYLHSEKSDEDEKKDEDEKDFNEMENDEKKLHCKYRKSCYESGVKPEIDADIQISSIYDLYSIPEQVEPRKMSLKERCKYRKSCYETGVLPDLGDSVESKIQDIVSKEVNSVVPSNIRELKTLCKYRKSCYNEVALSDSTDIVQKIRRRRVLEKEVRRRRSRRYKNRRREASLAADGYYRKPTMKEKLAAKKEKIAKEAEKAEKAAKKVVEPVQETVPEKVVKAAKKAVKAGKKIVEDPQETVEKIEEEVAEKAEKVTKNAGKATKKIVEDVTPEKKEDEPTVPEKIEKVAKKAVKTGKKIVEETLADDDDKKESEESVPEKVAKKAVKTGKKIIEETVSDDDDKEESENSVPEKVAKKAVKTGKKIVEEVKEEEPEASVPEKVAKVAKRAMKTGKKVVEEPVQALKEVLESESEEKKKEEEPEEEEEEKPKDKKSHKKQKKEKKVDEPEPEEDQKPEEPEQHESKKEEKASEEEVEDEKPSKKVNKLKKVAEVAEPVVKAVVHKVADKIKQKPKKAPVKVEKKKEKKIIDADKDGIPDHLDNNISPALRKLGCKYRKSCYQTGELADIEPVDVADIWSSPASAGIIDADKDGIPDHEDDHIKPSLRKLGCKYRKSCYETGKLGDIDPLVFWGSPAPSTKTSGKKIIDIDQDGIPDSEDEDISPALRKLGCKYRKSCYETGELGDIQPVVVSNIWASKQPSDFIDADKDGIPDHEDEHIKPSLRKLGCKYRKSCYETGELGDIEPVKVSHIWSSSPSSKSGIIDADKDGIPDHEDEHIKPSLRKLGCKYRKSCYETGELGDINPVEVSHIWSSPPPSKSGIIDVDKDGIPDSEDEHIAPSLRKLGCKYRKSCYETGELPAIIHPFDSHHHTLMETIREDESKHEALLRCKYRKSCYKQMGIKEKEEDEDIVDVEDKRKLLNKAPGIVSNKEREEPPPQPKKHHQKRGEKEKKRQESEEEEDDDDDKDDKKEKHESKPVDVPDDSVPIPVNLRVDDKLFCKYRKSCYASVKPRATREDHSGNIARLGPNGERLKCHIYYLSCREKFGLPPKEKAPMGPNGKRLCRKKKPE